MANVDTKRRVKHYVLNDARQWVDKGTGHVSWVYNDKQRSVSLIVKSENDGEFFISSFFLTQILDSVGAINQNDKFKVGL